ncbi:hypothetical protein [Amycolatopsis vastitatis]|uniref:Scaffolding protein n=1 Tax=Amycolatopsis vastitatis TaxID=1905142 RepID=A0A229SVZ6_9PSEU|nr:hypothetical protein [Amycolatopsis vastitatis]OXM63138.1 hypothetical protein CF165_32805 [Amycolatopsis vastitatis]
MTDHVIPSTPPTEGAVAAPPPTATTSTTSGGPDAPSTQAEAPPVDYKTLYEQTQGKLARAEQTAKDHKSKAAKLDELEAAQQSEAEKAAARASTAEAQVVALRRRAVDAEIRAAAGSGWADPTDAPRYLDEKDRYVGEDGEIDTAAITTDLAAVLLGRPHLARGDTPLPGRRPAPDPSQGARQSGPAGYDAQIAEAEKNGDWATAISLKNQRLVEQAAQQR